MFSIKNKAELLSHGNRDGRKIILDLMERVIPSLNPYSIVKKDLTFQNHVLQIGNKEFPLEDSNRIFVIGAGKATFPIALALEEILGDRITDGLILVKKGEEGVLKHIRFLEASHPIPDAVSLSGAKEIYAIASKAKKGDLVISCITGGSSSLMVYPKEGISLKDKGELNRILLYSGANILEINAVRKHISRIKGGHLALAIFPASILNLTVSDVIGDPLDYITDPTVPDTSTIHDALSVLDKYRLWDLLPSSIQKYFQTLGEDGETPKSFPPYSNVSTVVLIKTYSLMEKTVEFAKELGLKPFVLSSFFEGESRLLGEFFASIGKESICYQKDHSYPSLFIGGGETTVTIQDSQVGIGGPNQEFVLGAILSFQEDNIPKNFVVAAIDTDGTDGPTHVAGAIGDGFSYQRALDQNLSPLQELERHNVTPLFKELQDAIITGSTMTNVNDLKLLLICKKDD